MTRSIKNLIAAMLISISGYLSWTQILPAYNVTNFLEIHIEEKASLLASRAEILGKIEKLKKESSSKYIELQRLALIIPEKKGLPELIVSIENMYSASGVILPSLSVGGGRVLKDPLRSVSLEVQNEGTYGQLMTLLGYIEKNIRLIDINTIDIGLSKDLLPSGAEPKLSFRIRGISYYIQ